MIIHYLFIKYYLLFKRRIKKPNFYNRLYIFKYLKLIENSIKDKYLFILLGVLNLLR